MKRLSSLVLMVALANPMVGCGDDDESNGGPDGGGTGGSMQSSGGASSTGGSSSGGSKATGGAGGGPASGGSSNGGSSSGGKSSSGGAPSSGGTSGGEDDGGTAKDIVDTAVAAGSFTKLAGALTQAGLVDALKGTGPFTVFAPSDEAFAAFETANPGVLAGLSVAQLTDILKYHVVSGAAVESSALKDGQVVTTLNGAPALVKTEGGVKVQNAKVVTADVEASNGVIHVIDTIILPPANDIVQTAVAAGSFTTLAGALTSADLVNTLKGPGPFTVFAPNDAAFAKLSAVPTGQALKDVLLYHVVAGAVGSGDLKAGAVPTQLAGKSVTVGLTGGVKINASSVVTANIIAKNGVIHVIDTVLSPPQ
jgi:transforming growth factor-beta-induced protein